MSELERYRWCVYSVLMGKIEHSWQDREYVLSWFSDKEVQAKKYYRQYVKEGFSHGRRPELVGGGLIRSLGLLVTGVVCSERQSALNRTMKN